MSNISAALMINQIDRLSDYHKRKEVIAKIYEQAFSNMEGINLQKVPTNTKSARHLFTIWVAPKKRDETIFKLQNLGIGVTVNYRCVHLLTYYKKKFSLKEGTFPKAELIGNSTISLPFYPSLTDNEIDYIISSVKNVIL